MPEFLEVIAIIPARGGSKRLPGKNLVPLAGSPLISHTIRHAQNARRVAGVYVSTDHDEIASVASTMGAEVVRRPAELATDSASSESALLHVLDARRTTGLLDPDLVVFLQCTSPIRASDDIDRAVERLLQTGADSLFSACRETPFIWRDGVQGLESVTYDCHNRIRTQNWVPHYRENGSIYVLRPWILQNYKNRLGGKIAVHEMDFWCSFDLDSPQDFELINWIAVTMTKDGFFLAMPRDA